MATKPTSKKPAKKNIKKPVAKKSVKPQAKKTIAGTSQAAAARKVAMFIDAYLVNGNNATQAAITAGYSEKTAKSAACRLLTRVDVKDAIGKRAEKLADKMGLSLERTLREIARIGYGSAKNLYNSDGTAKKIHELDDDTAATISSVEIDALIVDKVEIGTTTKLKMWDKNAALEKAMKFHGAYEKDNTQKQPIILNLSAEDEDL